MELEFAVDGGRNPDSYGGLVFIIRIGERSTLKVTHEGGLDGIFRCRPLPLGKQRLVVIDGERVRVGPDLCQHSPCARQVIEVLPNLQLGTKEERVHAAIGSVHMACPMPEQLTTLTWVEFFKVDGDCDPLTLPGTEAPDKNQFR